MYRPIHVAANDIISVFMTELYSITHTHTHTPHLLFSHSSADKHFGCYHVFATVNSTVVSHLFYEEI